MGVIYASIPIIGGYVTWLYICNKRIENLGAEGEKLHRIQQSDNIVGDTIVVDGEEQRIGAGAKLGGVRLAVSDVEDQRRNKEMLQAFLKQQERKLRKAKMQDTQQESQTT